MACPTNGYWKIGVFRTLKTSFSDSLEGITNVKIVMKLRNLFCLDVTVIMNTYVWTLNLNFGLSKAELCFEYVSYFPV